MDKNIEAFNSVQKSQNTGKEYVAGKGVVPTTSAPAPVVSTPTLVDRYAPERTAINNNPNYNQPAPDENAIRESYRQRNTQLVDAIRSQFDKYIQEDTQAKQNLESRAYLSNLAGGMSGSIAGAGKEYKAAETGQKKIRQDEADREATIAKVLADGDLRASDEFNKKREQYLNSAQDKYQAEVTLNGNIKKTAEGEIGTLAQGRSYNELKTSNPKLIEQYKKELNLDDDQLSALFISKTPNPTQVKLGDGSIAYYQQTTDQNGNVAMKEVGRVKGSGGKTIKDSKITDNGVQILYTDGTYEFKGNSSGDTQPNSKPIAGTPKTFTLEDVSKGREILGRSGNGGYADPGIYYAVYKKWIEDGGTPNKFKELYPPEEFADPRRADQYPTFLQPTTTVVKKEAKTSTTDLQQSTTAGARTY